MRDFRLFADFIADKNFIKNFYLPLLSICNIDYFRAVWYNLI